MPIKKIKSEELKHTFSVTIPPETLQEHMKNRLNEVKNDVKLPGFRPGKVPEKLLEDRYGKEILQEVLEKVVSESVQQACENDNLRPVVQPQIIESNIDENFSSKKSVEFTFEISVAPDITEINYKSIKINEPQVNVAKEKIEEFLNNLAEQNKPTKPAPKGHKAKNNDTTIIDFKGFLGDTPFEGGEGSDFKLQLGSGQFIPGFEEGLIGCQEGQKLDLNVTFPDDYSSENLKGQNARFAVTVKAIETQGKPEINEELAKNLGLEDLKALRQRIEEMLSNSLTERCDEVKKVYLLNALDEQYTFPLPQVLIKTEFDAIWQQLMHAKENNQLEDDDKNKSDEQLEQEYRTIANRRVKLALLIQEVARKQKIEVSDAEASTEGMKRIQQMPPHMQQAYLQEIQKNPKILDELKLPILEKKVLEHILNQTTLIPQKLSESEFEKVEKQAFSDEQKPSKKSTSKKSDAKKASAKKASAKKASAKKS